MTLYRILEHIIKEKILMLKDLHPCRSDRNRPERQIAVALVDGKQYHGGMCDRFKGIVSLYAYCKQRGIGFRIMYNYPFELSDYLVPAAYDWTLGKGEYSECRRDCRIVYMRGESGKRLIRLNTRKQIHFYGNMDLLDLLNKDRGTGFTWGGLFKELFKPSEALSVRLEELRRSIGCEYDAAVFRFQNLLGDFPEYRFTPLESDEAKERLMDKCLDAVKGLLENLDPGTKLLVTSDSTTFLSKVSALEGTYIIPGTIVHMDGDRCHASSDGLSHIKSFLDFYMLTGARKISCIGTAEMYPSQFPQYAAEVNGIPFWRILLK